MPSTARASVRSWPSDEFVFDDGAPGKSVDEDEANDNGFEVQDEDDVFGLLDDYNTDDASEDEN